MLDQESEITKQSLAGVVPLLVTITCPCGRERGWTLMYKCLYCDTYFCRECAEEHFGKSVAEYQAKKKEELRTQMQGLAKKMKALTKEVKVRAERAPL